MVYIFGWPKTQTLLQEHYLSLCELGPSHQKGTFRFTLFSYSELPLSDFLLPWTHMLLTHHCTLHNQKRKVPDRTGIIRNLQGSFWVAHSVFSFSFLFSCRKLFIPANHINHYKSCDWSRASLCDSSCKWSPDSSCDSCVLDLIYRFSRLSFYGSTASGTFVVL